MSFRSKNFHRLVLVRQVHITSPSDFGVLRLTFSFTKWNSNSLSDIGVLHEKTTSRGKIRVTKWFFTMWSSRRCLHPLRWSLDWWRHQYDLSSLTSENWNSDPSESIPVRKRHFWRKNPTRIIVTRFGDF